MKKPPTGEPYAGKPHVRFGGRGGQSLPDPYHFSAEFRGFWILGSSPLLFGLAQQVSLSPLLCGGRVREGGAAVQNSDALMGCTAGPLPNPPPAKRRGEGIPLMHSFKSESQILILGYSIDFI